MPDEGERLQAIVAAYSLTCRWQMSCRGQHRLETLFTDVWVEQRQHEKRKHTMLTWIAEELEI